MDRFDQISGIASRSGDRACLARREGGAALIAALVILVILTIIGLAALNTTSLEQRMAINTQQAVRAFEAAESGLNMALSTGDAFDVYTAQTNEFTFGTGPQSTTATVVTSFVGWSTPKRGSGYSAVNYHSANFDQASTGEAASGGERTVHQGASQIVNKE